MKLDKTFIDGYGHSSISMNPSWWDRTPEMVILRRQKGKIDRSLGADCFSYVLLLLACILLGMHYLLFPDAALSALR